MTHIFTTPLNINNSELQNQLEKPEKRVIFLDLDLTLFDYTTAREQSAKKALKQLSLSVDLDDAYTIYSSIVEHSVGFQILGFPDLKRLWNHHDIYFLVYIFTTSDLSIQVKQIFDLVIKVEHSVNEENIQIIKKKNAKLINKLLQTYILIQGNLEIQKLVKQAVLKFEDETSKLKPFRNSRELLMSLKEKANFHIFVVTEGDQGIQSEKIRKLGLEDLINSHSLIVTDGLSKPENLLFEIGKLEKDLAERLEKMSKNQLISLQLDALRFLRDKLKLFERKKDRHFYGHAVHIALKIAMGNTDAKDFANISPEEWEILGPIKLATLGDRYFNDIKPLVEIFGQNRILSLQMLYGKYMDEKLGEFDLAPDFHIQNLGVARSILLTNDNWLKKDRLPRPKHFYIDLDNIFIQHASIGLTLPPPILTIAEAVMQDAGYSQKEILALKENLLVEINAFEKDNIILIERLMQIITNIDIVQNGRLDENKMRRS